MRRAAFFAVSVAIGGDERAAQVHIPIAAQQMAASAAATVAARATLKHGIQSQQVLNRGLHRDSTCLTPTYFSLLSGSYCPFAFGTLCLII
jgi:hypothetical protein